MDRQDLLLGLSLSHRCLFALTGFWTRCRGIDWTTSCVIIAAVSFIYDLDRLAERFVEEPFIRDVSEYRRISGTCEQSWGDASS
jgi:hypothetical protein